MKKLFSCLCVGLLAGINLFAGGSSESANSSKVELKVSHTLTNTEDAHVSMEEMARRIGERTQGNFVVQVYPNSELGGYNDNLEQMMRGANIMGLIGPDFLASYVPDLGILDGPFLFNDYTEFKKIQDSSWFAGVAKQLEDKGIKILSFKWYFGARHIAAKKPIHAPADMKGLRFRSAPSIGRVAMTSAMGANPIQMNWSETYSALNQGIVEACEAPLSTFYASKIYEVCKDIALTAHIQSILGLEVSAQWYNALSAEYQKIFMDEIDTTEKIHNDRVIGREAEWRKKLESEGAIINDKIDIAAFRKACEAFYTQFPEWTPGLYNTIRTILQ